LLDLTIYNLLNSVNKISVDQEFWRFFSQPFSLGRNYDQGLHEQQIRRLSLEQAEALMEALLDFRTSDDLGAWLAAQEASSI
jgi:hypothetical protein